MNKVPAGQDGKSAPDDTLLRIRDLRIEAKSSETWQPIVSGVDLTLRRGEVLGLIGESGAGKSTLGLAALGYFRQGCRVTSGVVEFDGRDLLTMNERDRRALRGSRIAYVAQSASASFNPAHRLIDQTIETSTARNASSIDATKAASIELFRRMQLPDPETIGLRYPHQVSGGQLQRIMTAMAMSTRPDLIVFDEPTTALDVTTQVEVLAAIRKVVREFNTAAIYISHDLAVVAQMADRVMVLRHGKLVEEAATRKMLAAPEADYTKTLWAVRNIEKPVRRAGEIALSIRGLSARYAGISHNVLDGISIDVPKGHTVALVGESGSGKSTLGRVVSGLLPPHSGEILLGGKALPTRFDGRSKELLRRIQFVYQSADTALNPRQTVREILGRPIEFFLGLRGTERDRKLGELMHLIELDASFVNRLPRELSGGQKQRVNLARALAADPDLIICDEVTSALDQVIQEGILKLLMRIQEEKGITYLFITHDIATVRAIADQVVVMHRGKVVEQGDRDDVLSGPSPAYTELLLSSVPDMNPDWLTNLLNARSGKIDNALPSNALRTIP
ncbi:ABC transporter ATP-binding protein [Shinella sp. S4-D37]|uniref:ABC transporter ATP-binding protein n=1 Tax=Shinella sp. S4-D37 TaxID=3161999 RepID=UPI003465D108